MDEKTPWGKLHEECIIHDFDNFVKYFDDELASVVLSLVICANDLKICLDLIFTEKNEFPHKANYFFKLAISHLRELATVVGKKGELVQNFLQRHNDKTLLESWKILEDNLANYEGLVKDVLKEVRDDAFHYEYSKETVSALKNFDKLQVAYQKKGVFKENPIGQVYLFGHKVSGTIMNVHLDKKSVQKMSEASSNLFTFVDSLLHIAQQEDVYLRSLVKKLTKNN